MAQIINLAITIFILYLIFTNFGTFLMIVGGVIVFFGVLIYFVKKSLQKKASNFKFQYQNFDFRDFNQDFKDFNFNNFNNGAFQGGFSSTSKLSEAKEFFGFTNGISPTKDDIKRKYKELARVYHPDLNGGDEEKMKMLNEYRDILMQYYS